MKFSKKLIIALALSTLGSALFAQGIVGTYDGFYYATAGTIEDDAYNFMNVLSWSKLDFNKFYAKTSIKSDSSGNLGFATHINDNSTLMLSWDGTLWTDSKMYNYFAALYGIGKLGVSVALNYDKYTTYSDQPIKYSPYIEVGYNLTDKIDLYGSFNFAFVKSQDDTLNRTVTETNPTVIASAQYKLNDSNNFTSTAGAYYRGAFTNTKDSSSTLDYTTNTNASTNGLYAYYKLNWKPIDNFTYGMYFTPYVTFTNSKATTTTGSSSTSTSSNTVTTLNFRLRNGFSANLTQKLILNGGIYTTIPSFTFEKDKDVTPGKFINSFYAGLSLNVTPNVRIDGYSYVSPSNGISLSEIWYTYVYLTCQVKF